MNTKAHSLNNYPKMQQTFNGTFYELYMFKFLKDELKDKILL